MNTLLLQPTDILFFRDGRPMEGSLAGHSAAWPLPNVTDAALHAALHRAQFKGVHAHRRGHKGVYSGQDQRERQFGNLVTAGPFPVSPEGQWFFPRPADLQSAGLNPNLVPTDRFDSVDSSLPDPLEYAVANCLPPSKNSVAKQWLNKTAFERYLNPKDGQDYRIKEKEEYDDICKHKEGCNDTCFVDFEHAIGITIDRDTQTAGQGEAEGKIYSAQYLRLRDGWKMGLLAKAEDKDFRNASGENDLVKVLFQGGGPHRIIVGGQQRICTAMIQHGHPIQLPRGMTQGFRKCADSNKHLVKWILLTPSIWPEIEEGTSKRGTQVQYHPGGWLPNWIASEDGQVLLHTVDSTERKRRRNLNYDSKGYPTDAGGAKSIAARLVAAIVSKPLAVTGWALPNEIDRPEGGAKSTHLAVPAGAVYYFEADSTEEANKLAAALNWHGAESNPTTIKNRRSTLLGEKGFGLGVCGTWDFYKKAKQEER